MANIYECADIVNNNCKNLSSGPYYIEDVNYEDDLDLTPVQTFYDHANVFVTGSTGFLGKILVEKLLRSCPTISTLYLLVRHKKGKDMEERLDEMFDDVVFSRLKKEYPKYRHKVVGVAGDCAAPDLGLNLQDRRVLIDEITVVFHVAATVRFDEKLKIATAINIRSPRDLLRLSKEMTNLKAFLHVSTIYANCLHKCIEEKIYPPAMEGEKLIQISENLPDKLLDRITPTLIGAYPNTYTYTKQIAESIVKEESSNLPVGIFRPAIVIATYKEPIPSWINNMYGPTGVSAGAGVGLLRVLHCNRKVNANIVPVDMCVNSLIVSAYEVAERFQKAKSENQCFEVPVYNYGSTVEQPITWGEFKHMTETHGIKYPSVKSIWYYSFDLYKHYSIYLLATFILHTVPALIADTALICMGKKPRLIKAYKKIHKFSAVISYFATQEWDIQSDGIKNQQLNMTESDRKIFFCDLKQLNWEEFYETYCKGIRIYLLQDPIETLPEAKVHFKRLYYAHQAVKALTIWGLLWVSWWMTKALLGRLYRL